MRASEKLRETASILGKTISSKYIDPVKEAETIFTDGLGIDKVTLLRDDLRLTPAQIKKIEKMLRERAKRKPLQYIIGHVEFYGLKIHVGEGVLIPRPETELIVEEALRRFDLRKFDKSKKLKGLDLCTGSGCLALALGKNLPAALIYATDISDIALRYARKNAMENNIKNVIFLKGSLFEPLKRDNVPLFDFIVSNPPYIKTSVIPTLQREVRDWEPHEALDGGKDGLFFIRKILGNASDFLKPEGIIMLEMAEKQSDAVRKIAYSSGIKTSTVIKDYAAIERVFVGINSAV